ncbi:MAG: glycoside hydrolase family 97 catalytic domain-containing protein, partial [Catalinimonas sp.]
TGYITVVEPSALGLAYDSTALTEGFTALELSGVSTGTESYTLASGKQLENSADYREQAYTFGRDGGPALVVRFRAFDDGLGFRYELDGEGTHSVREELTTFDVPTEGKAWMHAYDSVWMYAPGYETSYQNEVAIGEAAPAGKNGWAFPALFHTRDVWMLLTESNLDGTYCAVHLNDDPADGRYQVRMPEPNEAFDSLRVLPQITLPWSSPWRVLHLSDDLAEVTTSNLVYHLAAPAEADGDWIEPGTASWSWWYYSDSPKDYDQLVEYVDFAAEMGWRYSLVDANWNIMEGGDLKQLAEYAEEKGVKLLVWYNSGGPNNKVPEQPRDQMHTAEARREAFAMLRDLGVAGLKIDFFQSDKQHIIQQYVDILNDAAKYRMVINFHGCTLPRGWSRTYPHLLTMEAVLGAEAYKFNGEFPGRAPVHNTILPFTRNVVGPMDYTPVTLSDSKNPHVTTSAHELALAVVFESGLLHLADQPKAYRALPPVAVEYLKQVPTAWDETHLVDGYPGDRVFLARRSGDVWYFGGIQSGEEAASYELNMDFLPEGDYTLTLLEDGADRAVTSREVEVTNARPVTVELKPYGGVAGVLRAR